MAKITMQEFYENAELLEATYIPFESKLTIALTIVESLIDSHGSINTTILRRTATEMILDTITNIDMSLECEEIGLNGYDYLYYNEDCYNLLMGLIGFQFNEFMRIVKEQAKDYEDGKLKVVQNED